MNQQVVKSWVLIGLVSSQPAGLWHYFPCSSSFFSSFHITLIQKKEKCWHNKAYFLPANAFLLKYIFIVTSPGRTNLYNWYNVDTKLARLVKYLIITGYWWLDLCLASSSNYSSFNHQLYDSRLNRHETCPGLTSFTAENWVRTPTRPSLPSTHPTTHD